MSILHQKVSAIADDADPAKVQPSDWNAAHVFNPALTGILADPAGNNSFVGVAAASAGQFLRRKRNVSATTYEFTSLPQLISTDFAFSQVPAVNLTAGIANTVTLAPLPEGINNTYSPNRHYVRIVDAVAGNETVLITAVVGSTISFTPTLNHTSGNWTITSATAGIQEAVNAQTPVEVYIPAGTYQMYNKLFLYGHGGNTLRIVGAGTIATRLFRDSSYAAGDLIVWDGSINPGNFEARDFAVVNGGAGFNNTSGAGIKVTMSSSDRVNLDNVYVGDGFNAITVDGVGGGVFKAARCYFLVNPGYPYATDHTMILQYGGAIVDNCVIENLQQTTVNKAAIYLTTADGLQIHQCQIKGYDGINITNDPAKILNFVYIENNILDSFVRYGIYLDAGSHNAVFDQISIRDNHIVQSNGSGSSASVGVYINNDVWGLHMVGNIITGFRNTGVILGAANKCVKGAVIVGNVISNHNLANVGGSGLVISTDSAASNSLIAANTINVNGVATTAQNQQNGIYFSGATFNGYTVVGNQLRGNINTAIAHDGGATFANMVIANNGGVDDLVRVIASAASIATPGMQTRINVTGTTNITTLTPVFAGRKIVVTKTDAGSLTIGGGGNIASAAITMNQYSTVTCIYNESLAAWVCK
jgi:hypothetical protein